jgi:flagellar biosynthesis protein FlhB
MNNNYIDVGITKEILQLTIIILEQNYFQYDKTTTPSKRHKNTFFSCNRRLELFKSVLYYTVLVRTAFCLVCLFLRKTQVKTLSSLIRKPLMKLEQDHQDIYDETFFCIIYRISFCHNYCIKISYSSVFPHLY